MVGFRSFSKRAGELRTGEILVHLPFHRGLRPWLISSWV